MFDDFDAIFNREMKSFEYDEDYNGLVKLKGTLERVMFPKDGVMEDYEYAIVKVRPVELLDGFLHPKALNKNGDLSIKGKLPKLVWGEEWEFNLLLDEVHPQYGASYINKFARQDYEFKSEEDVKKFLSKILTETQVGNLYEAYEHPLEIIASMDTEGLTKVKGIGEVSAEKIISKYYSTLDYAEAYVELDEYGLSNNMIISLSQEYGSPTNLVAKIKENPYLLTEVEGIGFKKADQIALSGGMSHKDIKRVCAYIEYSLNDMGQQGFSWIESGQLIYMIEEEFGDDFDMSVIQEAVGMLVQLKKVWNEEKGKIGSYKIYQLELKIVKELIRLMGAEKPLVDDEWRERVKQAEQLQGWDYTKQQWEAIEKSINENVAIVLGLSGTGKTSTALGIVKAMNVDFFSLCCLAGKAAARLQEATGYPASTIHRLLGFKQGKFLHDRKTPLYDELVILDEYSLIGGELFYSLIQAIPTGSRFLMLGDMGQLASIGSMNIASDTIESEAIVKSELTEIHRQAQKSAIITDSIRIRHGEQIYEKGWMGHDIRGELQDLELDIYNNKNETPSKVLEYFKKYQALEPDILELQILSPMNLKGDSSVYALNKMIQDYYNPTEFDDNKPELTLSLNKNQFYNFRVGDKVMNVKNNYKLKNTNGEQRDIFNGYTGIIKDIMGDIMIINFPLADDNWDMVIPKSHWQGKKGIALSYVCSTHKAQGSGFNYVIYCLDSTHYVMYCRQQIYTGLTRAKKHAALLGQSDSVWDAINTDIVSEKQTHMKNLLIKQIGA